MPSMPRARWYVGGGLCEIDDGEGSNVSGDPVEAGGIPIVRGGSSSSLADDTSLYPSRCGSGGLGDPPPPPTPPIPQGGPDLPGHLPKTIVAAPVPGSRVPR